MSETSKSNFLNNAEELNDAPFLAGRSTTTFSLLIHHIAKCSPLTTSAIFYLIIL